MDKKIAIIGGSGAGEIFDNRVDTFLINTPFGISQPIALYYVEKKEILFTNRHALPGSKYFDHIMPPHRINSRALIYALAKLGASRIIAINSVGSLKKEIEIGSFALLSQFIDFTKNRQYTFFDGVYRGIDEVLGDSSRIVHVDLTKPFCEELNAIILESAKELNYEITSNCCYVCTEGPRLETPAEIKFFRNIGADVVGMTLVPEVILARELGLCYTSICVVTNYAAGMQERVSLEEVKEVYKKNEEKVKNLLISTIRKITNKKNCNC